ncbi:unnamed protein product, partial [Meganyctiphanes norvegica]
MVVNTEMDSMYLENLDEFINDAGKIVTYKWLSLTLDVPANVAKQMLYHFVQEQRNKDNDALNVTYLLSGIADGDNGKVHKVMVVREENLEVVKRTLKEIISVHVYSVAKSKLSDLANLYTADYDITKSKLASITKHSGIECSTAKVRSSDDLVKLQKQQAYQPPVETPTLPPKTKFSPKKEVTSKPAAAAAKGKSNQIANMFSKQTKKEDTISEVKSEKDASKHGKPSPTTKPGKPAAKGGISSFFTKGPVKTTKSPESAKTTPKSESSPTDSESPIIKKEIKEETSEEMDTDESPIVKSPVKKEIKEEVKKESPKKEIKKEFGKSKAKPKQTKISKKRKTLSEDPMPKKRSRIMQISDSESSDGEQEESDEECPIPPSPEPEKARIESESEEEIIPSTPQTDNSESTRGKRKKLVDKTYMDDDGFLVTKKEYEYVDNSEDEKEVKAEETKSKSPKKVEEQPKKTEPSPVKKNKQANIMSFFKKK